MIAGTPLNHSCARTSICYQGYRLLLAGGLVAFLFLVFVPKTYPVPRQRNREATQYWQLGTGSRIAFVQIQARGDRKPFPVIFLQEVPGGSLSDRVISELGQLADVGYDVYLYDQIVSEDIWQYTPDRHRRDLVALIDTLDAPKVILIGHSWGAILASMYVEAYPERVTKLVLTGPGPLIPIREELAQMRAPDSLHLQAPGFSNREANQKVRNFRIMATEW